jgi:hypothetical protein
MENIDAMLAMDIAAVGVQKSDEEIPLYPTSTLYQLKTLCTRVLVKTKMDSKPVKVTFMR